MAILGAILIIVGFLFCLSIIGAVIGVPLMFVGVICVAVGMMRRKTVITNVVQVSNMPGQQSWPNQGQDGSGREAPYREPLLEQPRKMITVNPEAQTAKAQASAEPYNRAKWDALVSFDDDIARVVQALQPFGQKYVDQLATAYLAINDKDYLPVICQKIIASAKNEGATANVTSMKAASARRA